MLWHKLRQGGVVQHEGIPKKIGSNAGADAHHCNGDADSVSKAVQ